MYVWSWSVVAAEPRISTYGHWKKKKRKNLQLAVNCSHFICSCWYFLFALFCLCFRSAMPPCEYVPDIRSVCSFEHLLLRLCLSQRLFFFLFVAGRVVRCIFWQPALWIPIKNILHLFITGVFFWSTIVSLVTLAPPTMPWLFRMRKNDNAIMLLHSVVSHTAKKKKEERWHEVSARVLCPFSIRFPCLWRSHVWQWTSHHWSQRIPLLFF